MNKYTFDQSRPAPGPSLEGKVCEVDVPQELRTIPQWVCWRSEDRSGSKPTKIPYNARTGGKASSTDPGTWSLFAEALAASTRYDGIGIVLTEELGMVGIDIDACVHEGKLDDRAAEVLKRIDSYTEFSPSGTGIRIFAFGTKPGPACKKGPFEMYTSGRYLTVTGNSLPGTRPEVMERTDSIAQVYHRYLDPSSSVIPPPPQRASPPNDAEILRIAREARNGHVFTELYAGNFSGYASQSEADLALCGMLAFYAGPDPSTIDALFRGSGLYRPKWDETHGRGTYGRITIETVLASRTEFYTGHSHCNGAHSTKGESKPTPIVEEWPDPPDSAAYYGLAGDIVNAIAPHTEADAIALLAHLVVSYGSITGRQPYVRIGRQRHYSNLYSVVVGETSRSRKGTARQDIHPLFAPGANDRQDAWHKDRVISNIPSGESLVHEVRDPLGKDPGEEDKRLLAFQPEFAFVLNVNRREGTTLSSMYRDAWDRGDLHNPSKTSKAMASNAHISLMGHITVDEVRKHLSETEQANGFANRILWLAVKRSKCLPLGGNLSDVDFELIRRRLWSAIEKAKDRQEVPFSQRARELYSHVYPELTADVPGLVGAITARSEAHTVRLALVYALLEGAPEIGPEHVLAALALVDYSERTCKYLFGDSVGDRDADRIRAALAKCGGLTLTDISRQVFGGNLNANRIQSALDTLRAQGIAGEVVHPPGQDGGRPAQVWNVTEAGAVSRTSGYLQAAKRFLRSERNEINEETHPGPADISSNSFLSFPETREKVRLEL